MISRRRFQFSLATLLIATAATAFAAHWFAAWRRADEARREFEAAKDAGELTRAHKVSSRQLAAELAVPFANVRKARIGFLNRTAMIERHYWNVLGVGLFPSEEARKAYWQKMDDYRKERESLERELGVKAEPNSSD